MGQAKEEELKKEDAKKPEVKVPAPKIHCNTQPQVVALEIKRYWQKFTEKGYY